ncbi:ABC transporter permease [Sporosarcina aquimarina]|uniref:ABC transporter permease subunit n=1 Tax=Sporosarcina aquimarina TaxID=114975 RepID=UPI00203B2E9F|nr:ABC transporter permease subunit [Sporosarcina aquimarina]MCM3756529.1 ABC transporter permease [Sporosarcina aquimarina]
MINGTIFKQTLRSNVKLWLMFTIVLSILQVVMIAVFDASTLENVGGLVEGTPLAGLLAQTTLLSMLASTFYSIHGVIFPIIFIIMTANSLIASQVDRGSMAYLLSTPTKRSTIIMTQAIYLIMALIVMFLIETVAGIVSIQVFQSDTDIVVSDFVMLNLGLLLLMFAISGISFFFSSYCNLTKNSLAFGAGIPIAFFLFHLLSTVDQSLDVLNYFTINALFDTTAILEGENYWWKLSVLLGIGIVLYIASLEVFKRKDLPL